MIGPAIIAMGVPVLIAILIGWWRARDPIENVRQFFTSLGIGLAFAAVLVFFVQMLWLGALMMANGGVAELAYWSLYWTTITGSIWVPAFVVTLIILALRKRRAEKGAL